MATMLHKKNTSKGLIIFWLATKKYHIQEVTKEKFFGFLQVFFKDTQVCSFSYCILQAKRETFANRVLFVLQSPSLFGFFNKECKTIPTHLHIISCQLIYQDSQIDFGSPEFVIWLVTRVGGFQVSRVEVDLQVHYHFGNWFIFGQEVFLFLYWGGLLFFVQV